VHLPIGYQAAAKPPLLIVLHGSGETAASIKTLSNFNSIADANVFVVAYPDSVGPQWVLNEPPNGGDLGFVAALIGDLRSSYNISQVYLAGYSDGGLMAQLVALCEPGLVQGIGLVEAGYASFMSACHGAIPPIPVIAFRGTADTLFPYAGGTIRGGWTVDSAADSQAQWQAIDGCASAVPVASTRSDAMNSAPSTTVTDTLESASCGNVAVQYWSGPWGHTWPGSATPVNAKDYLGDSLGPTSLDLAASQLIWQALRSPPPN